MKKMTRTQFKIGFRAAALAGLVLADIAVFTTPVLPLWGAIACGIGGVAMVALGARSIHKAVKEMGHSKSALAPAP